MDIAPVLTDPGVVREHLQLVIGPDERARHGIWFVLCDDEARPVVHVAVDDVPPDPPVAQCEAIVATMASTLVEAGEGSLLVALTRPGSGTISADERRWFHAVHDACRPHGVTVLAVYLVTPRDLVPIHLDDAG